MFCDICIKSFQDFHIVHTIFDQWLCQSTGFTFDGKIHILVGIQKWKKLILKFYSKSFCIKCGILASVDLLIAGDYIISRAFGKGDDGLFLWCQKIGIENTGRCGKLYTHPGVFGVRLCGQISLILIGNIQNQRGTSERLCAGSLRREDTGRGVNGRFFTGIFGFRTSGEKNYDPGKQQHKKETDR